MKILKIYYNNIPLDSVWYKVSLVEFHLMVFPEINNMGVTRSYKVNEWKVQFLWIFELVVWEHWFFVKFRSNTFRFIHEIAVIGEDSLSAILFVQSYDTTKFQFKTTEVCRWSLLTLLNITFSAPNHLYCETIY